MTPRQIFEDRITHLLGFRPGDGGEVTDAGLAEILAAADQYAAAMIELYAHPPYRPRRLEAS